MQMPVLRNTCVVLALAAVVSTGASGAELVKYTVKNGAIAKSLTGKPGDPAKGRKAAINRKLGNCLACHTMPAPKQQFHGNVGPPLAGVGSRLKEGELRLRLVDSKAVNPDTSMPGFYKNTGLHRVLKQWRGKTLLSAEQLEDIVAYLKTLKE